MEHCVVLRRRMENTKFLSIFIVTDNIVPILWKHKLRLVMTSACYIYQRLLDTSKNLLLHMLILVCSVGDCRLYPY